MGLLSLFQRGTAGDAPASSSAEPDAVAAARTRARRRLIGAAVLLGIGVVVFPLLFETQPRPVAVDIPIEIPRKDAAPPLAPPAPGPAMAAASAATVLPDAEPAAEAAASGPAAPAVAGRAPAALRPAEIIERSSEAGRELAAVPRAGEAARADAPKPDTPKPEAARPPRPEAASKPAARSDDGARAQALLDGKPVDKAAEKPGDKASDKAGDRVVVQVGAYTDADKLREARSKVEKLGLKTYTQVIEADGAKRTRVRVGPFASRAEADAAAARLKAAGLPVAILTL